MEQAAEKPIEKVLTVLNKTGSFHVVLYTSSLIFAVASSTLDVDNEVTRCSELVTCIRGTNHIGSRSLHLPKSNAHRIDEGMARLSVWSCVCKPNMGSGHGRALGKSGTQEPDGMFSAPNNSTMFHIPACLHNGR
jgi:hypothetical protein